MLIASIGYVIGGLSGAAWAVIIAWIISLAVAGIIFLGIYLDDFNKD